MHNFWKESTWRQFGAALDTLKNAINSCPDQLWGDQSRFHQFWYVAYHTLFYLDFYLTADVENFNPPEPFTLSELDPSGKLPDRIYSRAELLDYLASLREKCHATIMSLTLILGLALAIPVALAPEDETSKIRTGEVSSMEAMQVAQQPIWLAFLNPILGAAGALIGGRLKK